MYIHGRCTWWVLTMLLGGQVLTIFCTSNLQRTSVRMPLHNARPAGLVHLRDPRSVPQTPHRDEYLSSQSAIKQYLSCGYHKDAKGPAQGLCKARLLIYQYYGSPAAPRLRGDAAACSELRISSRCKDVALATCAKLHFDPARLVCACLVDCALSLAELERGTGKLTCVRLHV